MLTVRSLAPLCIVLGLGGVIQSASAAVDDAQPVPVQRGRAQLFVDDHLIESQADLKRTLRKPKKDNGGNVPVLALEDEFGDTKATLEANGTILYDPKLKKWVMYALGFAPSYQGPSGDRVRLYRFTSDDAMNWTKGDDGKPQRVEIDLTDPASGTSATNIDLFSCFYDEKDPAHPYKGWLHFANWPGEREGTYYMQSADGRTWKRGPMVNRSSSVTIKQDGRTLTGPGDVNIFSHDKLNDRFLGILRFASPVPVGPDNRLRSRVYTFVDKLDQPVDMSGVTRAALMPAAAAENGDQPWDEYYGSTAWRIGSNWLGGLRVWHGGGDYSYSAAGCAFLKLVVSRDGLNWQKVQFPNEDGVPEVWLPNGPEGGNEGRNDGGYMTEFSQGPLRLGDELILYYGASSWGKNQPREYRVTGGGIFRARLRPDGFVSVDGGTLTTKPLTFEGRELFVNGIGPITVEVSDPAGKVVAQAKLTGDSLRHRARFDGRSLRQTIGDGAARLRFTVPDGGQLYSFTVDPDPISAKEKQ